MDRIIRAMPGISILSIPNILSSCQTLLPSSQRPRQPQRRISPTLRTAPTPPPLTLIAKKKNMFHRLPRPDTSARTTGLSLSPRQSRRSWRRRMSTRCTLSPDRRGRTGMPRASTAGSAMKCSTRNHSPTPGGWPKQGRSATGGRTTTTTVVRIRPCRINPRLGSPRHWACLRSGSGLRPSPALRHAQ